MTRDFDDTLRGAAWDYEYIRALSIMECARLWPVPPGTYRRWREARIASGVGENQLKPVRIIKSAEIYTYFSDAAQDNPA